MRRRANKRAEPTDDANIYEDESCLLGFFNVESLTSQNDRKNRQAKRLRKWSTPKTTPMEKIALSMSNSSCFQPYR